MMQRKPTERVSGSNYQGRNVPLPSHNDPDMRVTVRASISLNGEPRHARIGFEGYWHDAGIAMKLDELAQFRDAINAVLAEADHG